MDSQQNTEFKLPKSEQQLRITVNIRFGNPNFEDCRNFGICKVELNTKLSTFFKNRGQSAKGVIVKRTNGLEIYFIKDSMTEKTNASYFKNGCFKIEKQKIIKGIVAESLGLNELSLKAGIYKVYETEKYLRIKIAI